MGDMKHEEFIPQNQQGKAFRNALKSINLLNLVDDVVDKWPQQNVSSKR